LILDTSTGINKLRGRVFRISDRLIVPINHPAAALYTPSRMQILKDDFKKVRDLLDNYQNPESITQVDEIQVQPQQGNGNKSMDSKEANDRETLESFDEKQLGLF
jgi:CO dehydrogenase nickel-insertion accessory protein CooC1